MQGRCWALKELQQYPLICLGSETMTYAFYNQFYLSNNLVLQPDTEAATTDQVVPLVKSGLGLGYVPQNFAKDALAAGDVFTIQLKEEIPPVMLCWCRMAAVFPTQLRANLPGC